MITLTVGEFASDVNLRVDHFGCVHCEVYWSPCWGGAWWSWQKGQSRQYLCPVHASEREPAPGWELVRLVPAGEG